MNLWEKGEYDYEINSAAEEVSKKSGVDMIHLKVHVFNQEGAYKIVDDYLLDAIPHKPRHIAEAHGLLPQYEAGKLNAVDLQGRTGRCKLAIQKDKEKVYPDKNVINDYLVPEENQSQSAEPPLTRPDGRSELDDTIPF